VRANRSVDLIPRWLLVPMIDRMIRKRAKPTRPGEESLAELLPLQRLDVQIFQEMATSEGFADLREEVLIMEGEKTPPPIHKALDALPGTLPCSRRITYRGVGHEAPIDGGAPGRVGEALRAFFA
jgi:hypothetical protein